MVSPDHSPPDAIGTLRNVVASAARIAQDLLRDPLLPRLLDVFGRMPPEDRETVLNVIEREVDLRNMSKEARGGPLSGINVAKPNPHARLYLRVTDSDPVPFVAPEEIVHAVMRAARVMHHAFQRRPDLGPVWEVAVAAVVEGLRRMEASERETVRWLHTRMLELVAESERDSD